jgi:hypothetical protein
MSAPACAAKKTVQVRPGAVDVTVGKGLDLDCGRTTTRPDSPGADISAQPGGGVLLTSNSARVAWVENAGKDEFDRCRALPDTAYQNKLTGLDRPAKPGRTICVLTDEANPALITLDRPSTEGQPSVKIHYSIRYDHR